jgi:hypothetical protein
MERYDCRGRQHGLRIRGRCRDVSLGIADRRFEVEECLGAAAPVARLGQIGKAQPQQTARKAVQPDTFGPVDDAEVSHHRRDLVAIVVLTQIPSPPLGQAGCPRLGGRKLQLSCILLQALAPRLAPNASLNFTG